MSKIETVFSECHRNNLCVDCDNTKCWHCGNIEADCPKWNCDFYHDCENCSFIKEFQEAERMRFASMRGETDEQIH